MTITGMAKGLGVSTMTIYRRCKKNGVLLDELRDTETGELTAAGVSVIASMFDVTTPQAALTDDATQMQQDNNGVAQTAPQGPENTSTAVLVAELRAKLDGQRVLIEQLTGERDDLRRQLAAVTAALQHEQEDRQAERRLLTGSVDGETDLPRRRRWPWSRR